MDEILGGWVPEGRILAHRPESRLLPGGLGPCEPVGMSGDRLDVLVTGRDGQGQQLVVRAPLRIGVVGQPDDRWPVLLSSQDRDGEGRHGVGYPCLVRVGDRLRLLHVGWRRLVGEVPFRNDLCIVDLDDDLQVGPSRFRRLFDDRDAPHGTGSCGVVEIGGRTGLLYTKFLGWDSVDGAMGPRYEVHHVWLGEDGLPASGGGLSIGLGEGESALCHPSLLVFGGELVLGAFCVRGDRYRIHLGISGPDLRFRRLGAVSALDVEPGAANEQCYPRFMQDGDRVVLLYSGDRYGRDALLAATWGGGDLGDLVVRLSRRWERRLP